MKPFTYLAPTSLAEALQMLAQHPEATPLAGGTNVLVDFKEGHRHVETLLSLRRIPELQVIIPGEPLRIGAGATMAQIAADAAIQEEYHALATAAGLLGSVQTRNMATIGGNLCNASPSADTAAPLLVLDATAVIAGLHGERRVPLSAFFVDRRQTVVASDELLREIELPPRPPRSGSVYVRHIPRAAMDISVVGVAAALALDAAGRVSRARLALGAVAPTPLRVPAAEARLEGQVPDAATFAAAAEIAAATARPVSDVRASADFRRHLVAVLARRALHAALVQATGTTPSANQG